MEKSPPRCTGDPNTCETCISIKSFFERLKKNKAEKTGIPSLMHLIKENGLMRDEEDNG